MSEHKDATRTLRRSARSARGERRSRITVTLSPSERVMLEQKALNSGKSMSRVLVEAALHARKHNHVDVAQLDAMVSELVQLRRQLVGIATNINQIAHHANATQIVTDEIVPTATAALHSVDEINDFLLRMTS